VRKKGPKKLRTTFSPIYSDMMQCPAWRAAEPTARALFAEFKHLYNRDTAAAVYMSVRKAAELLNVDAKTALTALRMLLHYGFIRQIKSGFFAGNGRGIATLWRLTDEPYLNEQPTLDFLKWDGTGFKRATKKTFPCVGKSPTGYVGESPTYARGKISHIRKPKPPKNPVGKFPTHLESLSVSTASEPVRARKGEPSEPEPTRPEPVAQIKPEPKLEPEPSAVDGDDMNDNKQEQDLISMIEVLRQFFGNRATSTAWYRHMQSFCGEGWSKPSFKRRLKTCKHRGWIRIIGQPDADLERAPWGSLFEATEIAPGASQRMGSDKVPESATMNGAADAAAKAAMELLQRLGKTAA
jgi:hypothetical protein